MKSLPEFYLFTLFKNESGTTISSTNKKFINRI